MFGESMQTMRIRWRQRVMKHPQGPAWLASLVKSGVSENGMGPNLVPPWVKAGGYPAGKWYWGEV